VLVAIGLGSLEFVLDEGQRKDWFGSNMILGFALASAFCLLALIPWELTRKDPIVDIRLLGRRQFGACFLVMLGTGAVLISTTQLLPQLLQTELNYTAMLAGLALSPAGIFTLMMMPIVGRLVGVVQPKYLIMFGACIVAFSMWHLTGLERRHHLWLRGAGRASSSRSGFRSCSCRSRRRPMTACRRTRPTRRRL
jgi:DHA2 family multidrug resistance protein